MYSPLASRVLGNNIVATHNDITDRIEATRDCLNTAQNDNDWPELRGHYLQTRELWPEVLTETQRRRSNLLALASLTTLRGSEDMGWDSDEDSDTSSTTSSTSSISDLYQRMLGDDEIEELIAEPEEAGDSGEEAEGHEGEADGISDSSHEEQSCPSPQPEEKQGDVDDTDELREEAQIFYRILASHYSHNHSDHLRFRRLQSTRPGPGPRFLYQVSSSCRRHRNRVRSPLRFEVSAATDPGDGGIGRRARLIGMRRSAYGMREILRSPLFQISARQREREAREKVRSAREAHEEVRYEAMWRRRFEKERERRKEREAGVRAGVEVGTAEAKQRRGSI